jgi:hypothetical protein
MRIWSIHPKYLDSKGLVALWREALLARKVLTGKTRGYKHHPQLLRFQEQTKPVALMDAYLLEIYKEAVVRGYSFDRKKIGRPFQGTKLRVTSGQIAYEFEHLKKKLFKRDKKKYLEIKDIASPRPHPLFLIKFGPVEFWERTTFENS